MISFCPQVELGLASFITDYRSFWRSSSQPISWLVQDTSY